MNPFRDHENEINRLDSKVSDLGEEIDRLNKENRRYKAVIAAYRLLIVGKDGLLLNYRSRDPRIPVASLDTIRRANEILKGLGEELP
jgi:hypothetical protein